MDFVQAQANAWQEIVRQMHADPIFMAINGGSLNGPGSSLAYTKSLREELPKLLRRYNVSTMLDAPCGDLNWMRRTELDFLWSYIGIDVDPQIIETNKKEMGAAPGVSFICANLLTRERFPQVDVILCRDFLAHLTNDYIALVLDRFRNSRSRYLLASNYPGVINDFDYVAEDYPWVGYLERSHDLTIEPFGLCRIDGIAESDGLGGVLSYPHELALFDLQA